VLLNDTVCSENINDTVKRVAMKIISIVVWEMKLPFAPCLGCKLLMLNKKPIKSTN
jgi:hypothetical protein